MHVGEQTHTSAEDAGAGRVEPRRVRAAGEDRRPGDRRHDHLDATKNEQDHQMRSDHDQGRSTVKRL